MRDDRDLERRLREARPAPLPEAFKAALRARMQAELLARRAPEAQGAGAGESAWQLVFGSRLAWVNAGLAVAVGGMLLLGALPSGGVAPPASARQAAAELGTFDTVAGTYPSGHLACRVAVATEKPRLPLATPGDGRRGQAPGDKAVQGSTTMRGRRGNVQDARVGHAESRVDGGPVVGVAGGEHRVGRALGVPAGGDA